MATIQCGLTRRIRRPLDVVRAHFLDMRHHIEHAVHKGVRYTILEQSGGKQRVRQQLKVMGLPTSDVLVLYQADPRTVVQDFVGGFFEGGRLSLHLTPDGPDGTSLDVRFFVPLRGVKGLLEPLLTRVVLKEAARALEEDRVDLEERRYQPDHLAVAMAASAAA